MPPVMVDWMVGALESFDRSVSGASASDVTLALVITVVVAVPLLTLVHELGHALAVRLRGLPLRSIVVGNTDDLTLRTGRVTVRLGRVLADGDVDGHVIYEATRATASDAMIVALAGPSANLVAAPVFAALARAGATGGTLDAGLWFLSGASVIFALGNLIPRGAPDNAEPMSDGRHAQIAWQRRGIPVANWPDIAPEPPTPRPRAQPTPSTGFRWPFAVALALAAVAAIAAGGPLAALPLVVLFGWALLTGAHRREL